MDKAEHDIAASDAEFVALKKEQRDGNIVVERATRGEAMHTLQERDENVRQGRAVRECQEDDLTPGDRVARLRLATGEGQRMIRQREVSQARILAESESRMPHSARPETDRGLNAYEKSDLTRQGNTDRSLKSGEMAGFTTRPLVRDDNLLSPQDFSHDGHYDEKNSLIVVGDIANRIQYVEKQTHQDCSLMAQEQFVHYYTGRPIPEDSLEKRAEQAGVYSPEKGTDYPGSGQTLILDEHQIPYTRSDQTDIIYVQHAIETDKGIIVSVDARMFYGDGKLPPGSKHAVTVMGEGLAPTTHKTEGFYILDSNNPDTVRFMNFASFNRAWERDMIAIPNLHKEGAGNHQA